jgi:hypothetical protein
LDFFVCENLRRPYSAEFRLRIHKCLCGQAGDGRAGGVAKVVDHVPSKCEALSSIPSFAKNKQAGDGVVQLFHILADYPSG